jgi:hypothetical protein
MKHLEQLHTATRKANKCNITTTVTEQLCTTAKKNKKSKAIPVTGRGDLQGSEMLRIPRCLDFFSTPSLFAICKKYNEQMLWFMDSDGEEESSVALFCIHKVQCLEWLLGRTYNYTLKTRITTTTIIR